MSKTNKGSRSNTATIAIIALLLAAVIVTGVITHGFKDWNACACFGHKYDDNGVCVRCKAEKPADEKEQTKDNAVISNVQSNGILLASAKLLNPQYEENGVSPQADTAYTLTATIEPSDATNKKVDWAVEFVNASSSWASGKTVTNYVTVTPTSDGALTATVECIKAFGEQIRVVVTSREDSAINASATVDYRKRAVSSSFYITTYNGGPIQGGIYYASESGGQITAQKNVNIPMDFTASSTEYTMCSSVTYGVGTLDCEDEISLTYSINTSARNYMGQAGHSPSSKPGCSNNTCNCPIDPSNPKSVTLTGSNAASSKIKFDKNFLISLSLYTGTTATNQKAKFNGLRSAFSTINRTDVNSKVGDIDFVITCGDYSFTYTLDIDVSTMSVLPTSVSLSENSLIF